MDRPIMTKRKVQAEKTRNKIYDVSIRLMKKSGFDNVTIEDISKKAGVSVGAFYHYFASKNDIFNEIYNQGDYYFEKTVAPNLKDGSSNEKIIRFFKYYAEFNLKNGLDFTKQLYNSQNKLFIKKNRYIQILLQNIIAEGQVKNEISNKMSPEEITDFLFISVRGIIYDWCLHEGDYDLEEAILKYLDQLLIIFRN